MNRPAFTLIELLVVIGVIAVLMSISIPAVFMASHEAKAVVCRSNIRQLSLALEAYHQENGTFPYGFDCSAVGTVVPAPPYPGYLMYDWAGRWWFQFLDIGLAEDFDRGTILWCPSRSIQDPGVKANVLCGNYGINRAVCKDAITMGSEFVGKPLALYQIRSSAQTLLLTDSGYSLISWRGATNAPGQPFENPAREGSFYVPGLEINKERALFPGQEEDAIHGRHPGRTVNAGFVDGHVSRVKADGLFVEKSGGNYINRLPLWLPRCSGSD